MTEEQDRALLHHLDAYWRAANFLSESLLGIDAHHADRRVVELWNECPRQPSPVAMALSG